MVTGLLPFPCEGERSQRSGSASSLITGSGGRTRRRSGAPDAETRSWQTLALSSTHRHVGSSRRRRRRCDKGQCDSCGKKILRSPAANIYSNEQERLAGVLKQPRELS